MTLEESRKLTGKLGLVKFLDGMGATFTGIWQAETIHDGPLRKVQWNRAADVYTVLDEAGNLMARSETDRRKTLRLVLPNGETLADFAIQKGWVSRYKYVFLGEQRLRPVFMLEGRIRTCGNDLVRIEHRDYKSDVTYICQPAMETAALVLAFLLFNTPNCSSRWK